MIGRRGRTRALEQKVWALEVTTEAVIRWAHDRVEAQQRDLVILAGRVAELEAAERTTVVGTYDDVVTVGPVIYEDLSRFHPISPLTAWRDSPTVTDPYE